ncbi:MAG: phosphatase PAP2 family protein [Chloroflexota bacterium]
MNDAIQDIINGAAGHSGLLDDLGKLAAKDLVFLIIPLLLFMWFWPREAGDRALGQRVAVLTVVAVAVALVVGMAVAQLHYADRPFVSDAGTTQLISHAPDNGFPSDHALVGFAAAGALSAWRLVVAGIAFAVALTIGVARIFVGIHWPTDILAGAAVGLVVGFSFAQAAPLLVTAQRRAASVLPAWLVASP